MDLVPKGRLCKLLYFGVARFCPSGTAGEKRRSINLTEGQFPHTVIIDLVQMSMFRFVLNEQVASGLYRNKDNSKSEGLYLCLYTVNHSREFLKTALTEIFTV